MYWFKKAIKWFRFIIKAVYLTVVNRGQIRFLGVVDIGSGVTIRVQQGGVLTLGRGSVLSANTYIWCAGHLTIGEKVFVNRGCYIACMESIEIEDYVMIADCVSINDNDHVLDIPEDQPRIDQGFTTAPVRIGRNAWIASKCTVLKGVSIGSCAVIAAGAVVNKNVESRWIAGGVPAKPIRCLNDNRCQSEYPVVQNKER
ncbi:MAG: acyltransferase [Gallionella sp.]|nr:acyltransferase [Gallionella sp.]